MIVACIAALVLVSALPAAATPPSPHQRPDQKPWVRDEVVVVYERDTSSTERASLRRAADVEHVEATGVARAEVVEVSETETVAETVAELEAQPGVAYAEPNYVMHATGTPNDPWFSRMWALQGGAGADIDAPQAWKFTTGSRAIRVAVVDTGVTTTHSDLAANIGPGGWDFVDNDSDPSDPHGHGTHVAGTIGATGDNGIGVSGVNWETSLMPLRVLGTDGSGSTSTIANAIAHARSKGADVVNLSLGGPYYSRLLSDAIAASPDMLFVVAAGNDASNNDDISQYPCDLPHSNIVCVASHDSDGGLSNFSNHSQSSVDLAAPGSYILSTTPSGYSYYSGTSMAAPHVAGAAALLLSVDPDASVAEVRDALLSGATRHSALVGKTVTGARLNVYESLVTFQPELIAPTETVTAPAPQPTTEPAPLESPTTTTDPAPAEPTDPVASVTHERAISLRLKSRLMAAGKVTVGDGYTSCAAGVVVKIKRNGTTIRNTRTDAEGAYRVVLANKSGRYTAKVTASAASASDSCDAATSRTRSYTRQSVQS